MSGEMAVRNPNGRGKAHRLSVEDGVEFVHCGATVGRWSKALTGHVGWIAQADRCRRCFPPT